MANDRTIETLLAQAGHFHDPASGAIVPPIQPSSTFARDEQYGLPSEHSYSRATNPVVSQAQDLLAALDGGEASLLFASGMAGITAALETLRHGERVVAPSVMYHGTRDWLNHLADARGVVVDWFDPADEDGLRNTVNGEPLKLIWIETAVNPTWDVVDIEQAALLAHDNGGWLAVDATISPPVTCKPLALGADIVFHSATKYLNGHSDLTGGVLVTAICDERWNEITKARLLMGGVPGSFEAWLLIRGLRTLALRYERASASALRIAQHLEHHPEIEAVLYQGLASHPRHTVAARQMMAGFGGMLSIRVKGGREKALAVAGRLKVFVRATSLGGVESLVEHRATIEPKSPKVPDDLLRLSVGIESGDDLIADLEQALRRG